MNAQAAPTASHDALTFTTGDYGLDRLLNSTTDFQVHGGHDFGLIQMDALERVRRRLVPISVAEEWPVGDVLLLTTSKVWVIGDWYEGAWRTARSEWVGSGSRAVLKSAYRTEDITHWLPLPLTGREET